MFDATSTQVSTPRFDRAILIAPNMYTTLSAAGVKLATAQPKTSLGRLGLRLRLQAEVSMLSVTATSAYVYALMEAAAPLIQFEDPPHGTDISVKALQDAYNLFLQQLATFQGEASAWIVTQQGSTAPSIFSQLGQVPETFNIINSAVLADFALLATLEKGSDEYNAVLTQLEKLIRAEQQPITQLNSMMQDLATNLQNAAETLSTSATTGVLKQLTDAYAGQIADLARDIQSCTATIVADGKKMIGIITGAAVSGAVGLAGLVLYFSPIGWIMMAGGAIGLYFAIEEILRLEAEIAKARHNIETDIDWTQKDATAAASVYLFSNQVKGFVSMNAAAQRELLALEALYSTLAQDIVDVLADLDRSQLEEAQKEWEEMVTAANVLKGVTVYLWPSPIQLSSSSTFAAVGGEVYALQNSGEVMRYRDGGSVVSDLGVKALSCVASGSTIVAIEGAPIDGAAPSGIASTFFVEAYDAANGTWTTLSNFAVCAVATGGGEIYAVKQERSSRQVWKYSGSAKVWSVLPPLPGLRVNTCDACSNVAVAGGRVFALTTNSARVYRLDDSKWTSLSDQLAASLITANGDKLAIIGVDQTLHLYDAAGGLRSTASSAIGVGQVSNGDQYLITKDLDLCFVDNQQSPCTSTKLRSNAVGVFVSDTDVVYCTDNLGTIWLLVDLGTNTWTVFGPSGTPAAA